MCKQGFTSKLLLQKSFRYKCLVRTVSHTSCVSMQKKIKKKEKLKKTPPNRDSWEMKDKISSNKFYTTVSNESDKEILTMAGLVKFPFPESFDLAAR